MVTNSINTQTSDEPISKAKAEVLLWRVRQIMAATGCVFAEAIDTVIKQDAEKILDRRTGV